MIHNLQFVQPMAKRNSFLFPLGQTLLVITIINKCWPKHVTWVNLHGKFAHQTKEQKLLLKKPAFRRHFNTKIDTAVTVCKNFNKTNFSYLQKLHRFLENWWSACIRNFHKEVKTWNSRLFNHTYLGYFRLPLRAWFLLLLGGIAQMKFRIKSINEFAV